MMWCARLLKQFHLIISVAAIIWGCQPEQEEITNNPNATLTFSTNAIHFDTLFSTLGSVTKRLKVYNPSKNAVIIDNISLGNPSDSPYTLYINGRKGRSFNHQMLMGNDSLLVLVEVLIDPNDTDLPFLVTDSILFLTNGNSQDVKLFTWGQDAYFIGKVVLTRDTIWTSKKPVVLLDTILVGTECTLTIEEGVKIFANHNAALFVAGSLKVKGTLENPVLFTNSRLDIKNAYGQWGGIIFLEDSKDNLIDFCKIRNAVYGVYNGIPHNNDEPGLVLSNTIIENTIVGLIGVGSNIHATNMLINNSAEHLVFNIGGGKYFYNHCTFSNSLAGLHQPRHNPSLVFSNFYQHDEEKIGKGLTVEIQNSIVWGNLKDEIHLDSVPEMTFDVLINHSLLKTSIEGYNRNNNILNKDPRFVDFVMYDYRLNSLSPAINKGDANYRIPYDLAGNERDQQPDMGAYERIKTE
jgi:hypothetical protein